MRGLIEVVLFAVTLVSLVVASYTDLKERIVPDWLSYSMIGSGIAVHYFWAFYESNLMIFVTSLAATGLAFLFALFLWKLGFWAGGDVKLLTGIAALNPTNYAVIKSILGLDYPLLSTISTPVFPVSVFVFSVYALFPIGIGIYMKKIFTNTQVKNKLKKEMPSQVKKALFFALAAAGITRIIDYYSAPPISGFIALVLAVFLMKKYFWIFSLFVFAAAMIIDAGTVYNAGMVFLVGIVFLLLLKIVALSNSVELKKKVSIEKLEEGMIPDITLLEKNDRIFEKKTSIKSILKHLKENNLEGLKEMLNPKARTVISSSQADGLSKEQIKELKWLAEKGLIEKEIRIKESTAFVPAILLAYIMLQTIGDILWNMLF